MTYILIFYQASWPTFLLEVTEHVDGEGSFSLPKSILNVSGDLAFRRRLLTRQTITFCFWGVIPIFSVTI